MDTLTLEDTVECFNLVLELKPTESERPFWSRLCASYRQIRQAGDEPQRRIAPVTPKRRYGDTSM